MNSVYYVCPYVWVWMLAELALGVRWRLRPAIPRTAAIAL